MNPELLQKLKTESKGISSSFIFVGILFHLYSSTMISKNRNLLADFQYKILWKWNANAHSVIFMEILASTNIISNQLKNICWCFSIIITLIFWKKHRWRKMNLLQQFCFISRKMYVVKIFFNVTKFIYFKIPKVSSI